MTTPTSDTTTALLAHHDRGGDGAPIVLLPGAGDLASEHRFLAAELAGQGRRVVVADLPGHGRSPLAASYGVAESARAIVDLLEHLDAGPAVVVGCSFAPAAAVWAAAERPDLISGVVAISPHLEAADNLMSRLQGMAISAVLRGRWAGRLWAGLYRSWYRSVPADLDTEILRLRAMLSDPARRRAVRETLLAHRRGVAERIEGMSTPALVVFGTADSHFPDPTAEAASVAERLDGTVLLVDGAGHYPHVERPDLVSATVGEFVDRVCPERG